MKLQLQAVPNKFFFNALFATLEPGDEVVVPSPYWVSYTDMVVLLGGIPKVIKCVQDQDFKLTAQMLEAAITPKTRWLMLNSPSNPTGAVYTKREIEKLGEVLALYPRVLILSDEIYEQINFTDKKTYSFVEACPQLKDRTVIVNGVSKTYAMTGWRIGYAAGPAALIKAINKITSQTTTCASAISQAGAVAAINGPQDCVKEMVSAYQSRRNLVIEYISQIPGLQLINPEGAFYAFPDCSELIGRKTRSGKKINNDTELVKYLLQEAKVAAVQGAAFGLEPYFRISTATSEANLKQAIDRISTALTN